jgi:hypothetical protein
MSKFLCGRRALVASITALSVVGLTGAASAITVPVGVVGGPVPFATAITAGPSLSEAGDEIGTFSGSLGGIIGSLFGSLLGEENVNDEVMFVNDKVMSDASFAVELIGSAIGSITL